ncbi:MAG: hypothetical protein JHD10_06825, partial [Sphingomonadaceae bacterium]|nr:hypothetical protein [Sphingomonadaceae bacterium]
SLDLSGRSVTGGGSFASNDAVRIRGLGGLIELSGNISARSGILLDAVDLIAIRGVVETDGVLDMATSDVVIGGITTAIGGVTNTPGNRLKVTSAGQLRSGRGLLLSLAGL